MKNGYGQFFKAARAVKQSEGAPRPQVRLGTFSGPKVSDVLKSLKARKRARKSFPVVPFLSASVLLVGLIYAHQNLEQIEKFVQKVEVTAFGHASAEEKAEKTAATKAEGAEKSAGEKGPANTPPKPAGKDWTSEQLAFFNKLEERKQQLDVKEKELQKLEEELQEQKLALEKRLRELEVVRTKIAARLDEKVKVDQEKVDKLVEFYSNMKPQNAAKVFEDIDEDLAVEILNKMKKKNAADIMNLLKSEKAQKLSEKFAGYKRN